MANKEIIKIKPTKFPKIQSATKKIGKLKVAAYARVSTEKDNQTARKQHYTKLIKAKRIESLPSYSLMKGLAEHLSKIYMPFRR
ncbi:hypothetical protein [Enterococcus hermanniensis]|uniref:hypothetical protein n=1 Tax=Enterococcus hermanniensis TaxID=249189 RepID=UPI0009003C9D|nr:hypothetical protein [Enterococcus hermanniensis]